MDTLRTAIISSAKGPLREIEKGVFARTYSFAPDFMGFSGHFPGHPVLPAFLQILTVVATAESARDRAIKVTSVIKAKFRIEILPNSDVEVKCRERFIGEKPGLEATLTVKEGIAASILLTFTESHDSFAKTV
jgi:3-hydroxyacyl-[acyl-carrier-protein] dehydratase